MKTQKLLVLGALGLGLTILASGPVLAKGARAGLSVKKQIGVSKDQKAQLKPIRQDVKEQAKAVKADATLSKKDRRSRLRTICADRRAKTGAVLTPEQEQKLAQLRAQKRSDKRATRGKI